MPRPPNENTIRIFNAFRKRVVELYGEANVEQNHHNFVKDKEAGDLADVDPELHEEIRGTTGPQMKKYRDRFETAENRAARDAGARVPGRIRSPKKAAPARANAVPRRLPPRRPLLLRRPPATWMRWRKC